MPLETTADADVAGERQFTLWQRVQFALVAWLASAFIAVVGRTLRVEFSWEEGSIGSLDNVHPGIYPFWHRCVLAATWIFRDRNFAVLTSKSKDGEFIARVIHRFGYVPIRGSSSRGGQRGLLEMQSFVKQGGGAAFTIDGPRGPRFVAKKGPVLLARTTGVPITAFYVSLERPWVLKTWDAMMIPRPFSRAYVRVAKKIVVPPDADDECLEKAHSEMQAALERVTAYADSQFSSANH
ncbi:MAG TPA: lysophospholipid acyltransferase family protein [Candidatus Eisenbacteria bacterium]|nr:lysophospholipid acyltransferase family protein [Candidatus Eisenbacteria bacterium]